MSQLVATRRLLHLGTILAAVGLLALAEDNWAPAAAAVPLVGLLLFSMFEVLLPLPRSGRRTSETGDRMLLRDESEVTLDMTNVPVPYQLRMRDKTVEGLRVVPGSERAPFVAKGRLVGRYTLQAVRRGHHTLGPVVVERTGWLGLFRRTAEVPIVDPVEVLPASADGLGVRVRPKPPSHAGATTDAMRRGPGDEFFALRPYQPGDSIGDVNWKASARMNRIITNEFLPEEPPRYVLYVDTRATGTEEGEPDVFERSLELASILMEALMEARAQVGIVTVSAHSVFLVPGSGQNQRKRLRSMIQQCVPGQPAPIRDLVLASLAHVPARAEAILVTSDIYDPTLRHAVLTLKGRHGRVTLITPGYPEAKGKDIDAVARRAAGALLNTEQNATLEQFVGYADQVAQWPPDEPILLTLDRLGMTRRNR